MAKHLPSHGWNPIVISVDERQYTEANDPALAALVPSDLEQIRTGAMPASLARRLGFGDIGLRAYLQIAKALESSVRRHSPKVVFITGSPYYPMLLARTVVKRWGLPVVLDFQDPWVSAEGARQPKWSKAGHAHRLATMLEPAAVRKAAWVTSVSETQNDEMAARYAWMKREHMTAIPIGGDPADFEELRARPPSKLAIDLPADRINLCYVGTFLPRATPVVRVLFEAIAQLKLQRSDLAARLNLVFVGTSNQPNPPIGDPNAHRVRTVAEETGIGELVHEHPARVPFMDALALLANAQGLLLLGSDEPHYTASKIYPGLMSGRPFLSIFHESSSSHAILSRAGGGWRHSFANTAQLSGMAAAVFESLHQLATGAFPPPAMPSVYEPYTAHAVAGQFANVFERVLQKSTGADQA